MPILGTSALLHLLGIAGDMGGARGAGARGDSPKIKVSNDLASLGPLVYYPALKGWRVAANGAGEVPTSTVAD